MLSGPLALLASNLLSFALIASLVKIISVKNVSLLRGDSVGTLVRSSLVKTEQKKSLSISAFSLSDFDRVLSFLVRLAMPVTLFSFVFMYFQNPFGFILLLLATFLSYSLIVFLIVCLVLFQISIYFL